MQQPQSHLVRQKLHECRANLNVNKLRFKATARRTSLNIQLVQYISILYYRLLLKYRVTVLCVSIFKKKLLPKRFQTCDQGYVKSFKP
jgi:hypothetical protein